MPRLLHHISARYPTHYRACKFREWVEVILTLRYKLFKRYADNMLAFNCN